MALPPSYRPPEQSAAGQLFDSLFVMALVAATLLVCLYLTVLSAGPPPEPAAPAPVVSAEPATPAAADTSTAAAPAAADAGSTAAAVAVAATAQGTLTADQEKLKAERFAALGWDEAKVVERKAAIAAKFYEFDWLMLLFTAVVVVGYFFFLVHVSEQGLREVINERFGPATGTQSKE